MADVDSRAGSGYATSEILSYVGDLHARHDAGLSAAFAAPQSEDMPAIQVGPSEGKALEIFLRLVGARRVVEVGTLAGYSAIRMARALAPGGHLFTIEFEPRHAEVARSRIEAAGFADRVTVLVGAGLDVLPTLVDQGPFDAVFIDADKTNYDGYGRWAAANVRPGGLLLGDNAFLFGRLLEQSPEAAAMRRFHEEAALHFDTVCLPTPDGLLLGVRKGVLAPESSGAA
ncbi:MAG: O-methyltransferase [Thermoanaerobaculia bacterium]